MKTHIHSIALAAALAPAFAAAEQVELAFFSHIDAEMAEQDVFVARDAGVFRVTGAEIDPDAIIYAAAEAVPHDPFDPAATGPYPMGSDLGLTMGSWLAAEGSGQFHCTEAGGEIAVDFAGLVPGGVYTMWHFFMPMPPTDPFTGTLDVPYGARDGSQSAFTADMDGRASFVRSTDTCLQMSGPQTAAGLAIAWHSDGQTYGALPGAFGENTHVQMFTLLP